MKLTADLINNSLSKLNAVGDRELTLRGRNTRLILDNPVAKKSNYRLYVIYKLPQLRVLDFNKVKLAERKEAEKLFRNADGTDSAYCNDISDQKTKTFEPGEGLNNTSDVGHGLTPDEQLKIKEALRQATSLDEISRLERLLKAGHVPTTNK
ncbi:unnamed protein product [Mucor hiemalis]